MNKSKRKEWLSALIEAVIIAILLYFLFWPFSINGSSMENTFKTGDRVLVSRIAPYLDIINRNDIILCEITLNGAEEIIVKRVIGKPGDHIKIKNNEVYVNNILLTEPYIKEQASTAGNIDITLGKDEYYIMGDNRKKSTDSRKFGTIKKSNIEAKVIFKWFPFSEIGAIE